MIREVLEAGADVVAVALAEPPDFSDIGPDSNGVPKAGALHTAAQVLMFFGLGISFLALLAGLIGWVAGHMAGGMHISQNARSHILRAGVGGILITSAGAIWTWITAV
jgi:hypothetical protein